MYHVFANLMEILNVTMHLTPTTVPLKVLILQFPLLDPSKPPVHVQMTHHFKKRTIFHNIILSGVIFLKISWRFLI